MSRQISDSTSIATTQVATSVGFNAGEYVYSYGNNIIGSKGSAVALYPLTSNIGGVVNTDYAFTLACKLATQKGVAINSGIFTGSTAPAGTIANAATFINKINSYSSNKVAALTGGNTVAVYFTNSTTLVGAIYDSTGTIVGSPLTISTSVNSGYVGGISVTGLSDGGYVVAYLYTGTGYPYYRRVTSANSAYGAEVQIQALSYSSYISVCGLQDGGFALAYYTGSSTYSYRSYTSASVANTTDLNRAFYYYNTMYNLGAIDIICLGNGKQVVSCSNVSQAVSDPCIPTYNYYVAGGSYLYTSALAYSSVGGTFLNSVGIDTYPTNTTMMIKSCPVGTTSKYALAINCLPSALCYLYLNDSTYGSPISITNSSSAVYPVQAQGNDVYLVYDYGGTIAGEYATANSAVTQFTLGGLVNLYNTLSVNNYALSAAATRNGKIVIGYSLAVRTGTIAATVATSGTAGQFTCGNSTLSVGDKITISGVRAGTGTITGYVNPTRYSVSSVTGTSPNVTGFTLQSDAGVAIVTTAGTLTGLTYLTDLNTPQKMTITNYLVTNGASYDGANTGQAEGYNLLGVALTSAAAGTTGIVQTKGIATLAAGSQAVASPVSFNTQGTIYGGQGMGNSGTIVGTTVTLGGL